MRGEFEVDPEALLGFLEAPGAFSLLAKALPDIGDDAVMLFIPVLMRVVCYCQEFQHVKVSGRIIRAHVLLICSVHNLILDYSPNSKNMVVHDTCSNLAQILHLEQPNI